MRDAQFDEGRGVCIFGGLCLPGVPHPFSRTGVGAIGFPWQVSAQRRLSSWYGVGLSGGRAAIGTTLGQKRDLAEYLHVSYEVTTVAPMFAVSPGSWFRLAAGPVLYSANVRGGAPGGARASESHMGVGLVSEVAVDVPPRSRVFGELLFQYRRIGDVEAGPFTTSRGLSGHGSTLPVTTVSMNHWFLGFGMGMRF
jgi:hypothetical protein